MNPYYVTFLAIGLPLIAVELYGVARRPGGRAGGKDTISEMWWETRNRYPFLTVAMVLFLLWLLYHFTLEGWKRGGAKGLSASMLREAPGKLRERAAVLLKAAPARAAAVVAALTMAQFVVVPMLPGPWQARAAGYLSTAIGAVTAVVKAVQKVTPVEPAERGLLPSD